MTSDLARHALRRTLMTIPTLAVVSLVMFLLLVLGPDPLATLEQEAPTDVDVAAIAEQNGWDRPWFVQYGDWAGGFATGDWGTSTRTGDPARAVIAERLPLTIALATTATVLSLVIALVVGTWSALRAGSASERTAIGVLVAASAVPSFMIALALQWWAVTARDATGQTIVYVGGMPRSDSLGELVQRFALPVLVLTAVQTATWVRYHRAAMLDVLGLDHLVAARAKGLSERVVIARHAVRCGLVPLVTLVALEVGTTLGGALVVETVFGLPGTGRLLVESVQTYDVTVALDLVVLGAVAIVISTSVGDVLTARLDPRSVHA